MIRFLTIVGVVICITGCSSKNEGGPLASARGDTQPSSYSLDVPFTSQAPHGNWDDPYQEACEEASLLMVHAFFEGISLDTDESDRQIREIIEWEAEHNYNEDVSIEELAEIAKEYYGYESVILSDPSIMELKQYISDGYPIIVPAAGRELGNPYFSGEGPWYHMLVLTGYTPLSFITNDPGTRRGEEYKYSHSTIMNAIHNWTGVKEDIGLGSKTVLVLRNQSSPQQ